jgi:type VI secretion system protein ImpK
METLSEIFSGLFEYLLVFRDLHAEDRPNFDTFRNEVIVSLDRAETTSRENRISPTDFQLAKFAVVAFIDELVLNSSWEQKNQWKANTLQMLYFSEHTAGETFFQRLKELEPDQAGVLEIYFFCMCLGFKGELNRNQGKLMTIRHEVLQRLDHRDKYSSTKLTPSAYETALHGEKTQWRLPSFLWALLPLGGLVVVFIAYRLILQLQVNNIIDMIR